MVRAIAPPAAAAAAVALLPAAPGWLMALIGGGAAAALCWALQGRAEAPQPARRSPAPDDATLLHGVIERAPDPTLLIDGAGMLLSVSTSASALIDGAAPGRHIAEAFRSPSVLGAVEDAVSLGRDDDFDFTLRTPRETLVSVSVRALPGRESDPGAPRALLVMQDRSALRRAAETRMDFVANASHELRTPLAAISGFIETLRGPAKDDAQAQERFLEIIAGETARMTRLVNDLLSLSRIELDENVAPTEPQDLRDAVRAALDTVAPLARRRGQAIEARLPDKPLMVPGAADELTQVFINLLENAIRYGGGARAIEIGVAAPGTPDDGHIAVSVQDHGRGVDPRHIPRLTERFYRVDAGASRASGGTGLGLAIVKHIVSRHRGGLEIESAPGEGARFTVMLPRV